MRNKPRKPEKWVKHVDQKMEELVKDVQDSRTQWDDDCEEVFGYYVGDRNVIFNDKAISSRARKEAGAPEQNHIPMLRWTVDTLVASTNSDIKPRYIPKIDQDVQDTTVDDIARMGNAVFDACRTWIGWDTLMYKLGLENYLFGRSYVAGYIDSKKAYPTQRADLMLLNAWQVYSTPGIAFEHASEVITTRYVDKDELKAQYPEFAEDIEVLKTGGKRQADEGGKGTQQGMYSKWLGKIPGYGDKGTIIDKNALLVRERWKFDPSLSTYSREQDERDIELEHGLLDIAIEGADPQPLAMLEQMLKDEQYHSDHSVEHWLKYREIEENKQKARKGGGYVDPQTGVVTQQLMWGPGQQAVADQALAALKQHVQIHDQLADDMEDWEEGKYPKYEGGWRHSIIVGEGAEGEVVGVYDGYSKFYDFGHSGPPIFEFNTGPGVLNHVGESVAMLLLDENKLLDSFINLAKDNANVFGSHQWALESSLKDNPEVQISVDPYTPSYFPDTALQTGKATQIKAMGIPPDVYQMIPMMISLAQQTSGAFGSIRGERQKGVRSGSHEQFLSQQNRLQLDQMHRLWKQPLERLCIMFLKMTFAVPPDDRFVKPMIEGKVIPVDFKLMNSIDFTIEVIMSPGGTSSTEERNSFILGIVQNLMANPAIIQAGGLPAMFRMFAKSIKLTAPDMAEAIMEFAEQLEGMKQQMQQQMQMEQQGQPAPSA